MIYRTFLGNEGELKQVDDMKYRMSLSHFEVPAYKVLEFLFRQSMIHPKGGNHRFRLEKVFSGKDYAFGMAQYIDDMVVPELFEQIAPERRLELVLGEIRKCEDKKAELSKSLAVKIKYNSKVPALLEFGFEKVLLNEMFVGDLMEKSTIFKDGPGATLDGLSDQSESYLKFQDGSFKSRFHRNRYFYNYVGFANAIFLPFILLVHEKQKLGHQFNKFLSRKMVWEHSDNEKLPLLKEPTEIRENFESRKLFDRVYRNKKYVAACEDKVENEFHLIDEAFLNLLEAEQSNIKTP